MRTGNPSRMDFPASRLRENGDGKAEEVQRIFEDGWEGFDERIPVALRRKRCVDSSGDGVGNEVGIFNEYADFVFPVGDTDRPEESGSRDVESRGKGAEKLFPFHGAWESDLSLDGEGG